MANHLFIGLGGTGGKVLRELRKNMYFCTRYIEQYLVNYTFNRLKINELH